MVFANGPDTEVQFLVESYQDSKMILDADLLNSKHLLRVSNPGCGVASSLALRCGSYRKGSLQQESKKIPDLTGSWQQNMYLSLYSKGSKRVTQGFTVRGSWRPNRTAIYWPPTLMAVSVVSFSFSRAAQPEAQGPSSLLDDGVLYCISSPTGLLPKLHQGSRGPLRPGVAFPTTSFLRRLIPNCLTSCLDRVI